MAITVDSGAVLDCKKLLDKLAFIQRTFDEDINLPLQNERRTDNVKFEAQGLMHDMQHAFDMVTKLHAEMTGNMSHPIFNKAL